MMYMFCPKCKKLLLLGSWEVPITKFCKSCGSCLYPVKIINGTDVNSEDL